MIFFKLIHGNHYYVQIVIKIVQVKIDQPVLALIAAEVFEVEVAADPTQRIGGQCVVVAEVLIEQMTGTPVEPEGVFGHRLIFEGGIGR